MKTPSGENMLAMKADQKFQNNQSLCSKLIRLKYKKFMQRIIKTCPDRDIMVQIPKDKKETLGVARKELFKNLK